jgi:Holliday junction resolvase
MPDTTLQEIREILKEVSGSQKETEKRFRETDAKFKETDARFKETDKRINNAFRLFETQWGKLIESLVDGDLIRLLRERSIEVTDTSTRRKGKKNDIDYEFDIIAHNGHEIVIVEVKTTFRVKYVKKFLEQLKVIKQLLPEYKAFKVYGAVAFLNEADDAATFAEKKKLFVIRATGDSAAITNAADFVPKAW